MIRGLVAIVGVGTVAVVATYALVRLEDVKRAAATKRERRYQEEIADLEGQVRYWANRGRGENPRGERPPKK